MIVLLVDGCCLGNDDAGLDEERAEVAVVIPSEIRKSARVTRRGRNYKAFCGTIGQVPQNGMLAMPHKQPSATSKQGVTHFVDFGVVRDIRHRFWSFFKNE